MLEVSSSPTLRLAAMVCAGQAASVAARAWAPGLQRQRHMCYSLRQADDASGAAPEWSRRPTLGMGFTHAGRP